MTDWQIFYGNQENRSGSIDELPPPPAWRTFAKDINKETLEQRWQEIQKLVDENSREYQRGQSFRVQQKSSQDLVQEESSQDLGESQKYQELLQGVNAAIFLRRPLLVTGRPGSGKTTLAYAIAYELKLGTVLTWAITTRTILKDGLYNYDAIGRLQNLQLLKLQKELGQVTESNLSEEIGQYLQLGAVGTAFLPSLHPRVLLIDEIDKSDINLPNDLLNLFEEGGYIIPELERLKAKTVSVRTADKDLPTIIPKGKVQCSQFPIVILTSNGERDFPPAFLRRCIRVKMPNPNNKIFLQQVVEAHFQQDQNQKSWQETKNTINQLIDEFVEEQKGIGKEVATDQLLNAIYLFSRERRPKDDIKYLKELLLKRLDSQEDR